MTTNSAVQLEQVSKSYQMGKNSVTALNNVSLSISAGQFVAVMGASGSGKSTLLHITAGLSTPDSGQVTLFGQSIQTLQDDDLTRFRRHKIGLIFQSFNLIPTMTALENVCLPLMIGGKRKAEVQDQASQLLETVGLGARLHHRPDELSGGQQQRVAIARALINQAPLLLADEPTGNLDSKSGDEILQLMQDLVKQQGRTIVMVTHDAKASSYADRVITLTDGHITHDSNNATADKKGEQA